MIHEAWNPALAVRERLIERGEDPLLASQLRREIQGKRLPVRIEPANGSVSRRQRFRYRRGEPGQAPP